MDFIVEYAVLIAPEESLCGSKDAFISFLGANSKFQVNAQDRCINFSDESDTISLIYDIADEEVPNNQRLFIIKLKFTASEDKDLDFECIYNFLREFRKPIKRLNLTIYSLRDDLSYYYAGKVYPEINRIENLLRKLILRFFLQNIGAGWENEVYKKEEIKGKISISKDKEEKALKRHEEGSILHEMDFIHLSLLLTTPWRSLSRGDVEKIIENWDEDELENLKKYLPKSNWNRYFAEVIDYEESKFKKKWERLYELRCLVAHNRSITPKEYKEIMDLVSELEEEIQKALDGIENIVVPEEEKEDVAQSASRVAMQNFELQISSLGYVAKIHQELARQFGSIDAIRAMTVLNSFAALPQSLSLQPAILEAFRNNFTPDSAIPGSLRGIVGKHSQTSGNRTYNNEEEDLEDLEDDS